MRIYNKAKVMELNKDYAVKDGRYVILLDGNPYELYDYRLEYLKFANTGRKPVFKSRYYYHCIPYLLSQYDCITGFSGSVGSRSERSFLKEQFKAWCFDTPSFLDTCPNVSKFPPALIGLCPQFKNKPCVHVCKTTDSQMVKIIDMCCTLHANVPVLVIAKSTDEAIALEIKLKEVLRQAEPVDTQDGCVQLFLKLKVGTMTLDKDNWSKYVRRATTRNKDTGKFHITITDPFGGRGHDFDVHDDEVNRLGGLAVIMTSVPPSEREWIQWKGRTARKDNAGQYAVVLSLEEDDSPLKTSPELLKDFVLRDDSGNEIPDIFDEPLIAKLLSVRDDGQQAKLDIIESKIALGRRLNRLCDQFYRKYGAMDDQTWPKNQFEVMLRNLLCDEVIVGPAIDKAHRDFGLVEHEAGADVFSIPNIGDRSFWNDLHEREWAHSAHVQEQQYDTQLPMPLPPSRNQHSLPPHPPSPHSTAQHSSHLNQQNPLRNTPVLPTHGQSLPFPTSSRRDFLATPNEVPRHIAPSQQHSIEGDWEQQHPPIPSIEQYLIEPNSVRHLLQSHQQAIHSTPTQDSLSLLVDSFARNIESKSKISNPLRSRNRNVAETKGRDASTSELRTPTHLNFEEATVTNYNLSGHLDDLDDKSPIFDDLYAEKEEMVVSVVSNHDQAKDAKGYATADLMDFALAEFDYDEPDPIPLSPPVNSNAQPKSTPLIINITDYKPPLPPSHSEISASNHQQQGGDNGAKVATFREANTAGSNEKVASTIVGITTSTEKVAANLIRAQGALVAHSKLSEICVGETKKVTNSWTPDLKTKLFNVAEDNKGLIVGVYDIVGTNAGKGVDGLEISGAINKTSFDFTLVFQAKAAKESDQFKLALYGRKRLEAKWNNITVLFEEVVVKPPTRLRPNASFVFHNAKNALKIVARGTVTISSREDYRSLPGSPVFPDIHLSYDGSSAVHLPGGLPDGMITVTPNIPGFGKKQSEKFLLYQGEVNPLQLQMNLSATDLTGLEWRVVLTWAQTPIDLDLYCATNFDPLKVYYAFQNKNGRNNANKGNIELDIDQRLGLGPETITFTPFANRKYRFYVHNFSGEKALSESCAKVVVHKGDGESLSFEVPTDVVVDSGNNHAKYWHVFDLINGEIQVANEVLLKMNAFQ